MELENFTLSEVSQAQKAKRHMFSSYADYRPTRAAIIMDMGHTKGRLHMGRIGQGEDTKILNVIDVCSLYRNECRNLKLARAAM
jgi:hypothetical protein